MKIIRNFLRHIFVPGNHNNHQAISVSHIALTAYLVLAIASISILPNLKHDPESVLGFAIDINSQKLLSTTNEKRVANGLSPLRANSKLALAASDKAKDMFEKGYWSHFGPNGETPWNFILSQGYDYEYAGENLAKNFLTSEAVVDAWMESPTHRANILNGNYKEVGYAVVDGALNGEDTTLVVQMFGRTVDSPNLVSSLLSSRSESEVKQASTSSDLTEVKEQNTKESSTSALPIVPPADNNTSVQPSTKTPNINLLPAYQFLSGVLVAFLIIAFAIDLYHISHTDYHRHRGKHIAHLIFLIAALIGIFMISSGGII